MLLLHKGLWYLDLLLTLRVQEHLSVVVERMMYLHLLVRLRLLRFRIGLLSASITLELVLFGLY